MAYKPDKHGRDHCPGGEDPIPCLTALATFRAAIREIADPETDRVKYPNDLGDADNIYWDLWDTNFDSTIFDTGPYEETNNVNEGPVVAGVGLLASGLYSIHAIIDVQEFFDGKTLFRSNYDRGQMEFREHNQNWDANQGIQLNHWRYYNVLDDEDTFADGESVEIVFGQENTAIFGGGSDLWVPGGTDGAWGIVPRLEVTYWGPITPSDATWINGNIDL